MRLAVMQPYLFPYLGYFQLINAVDTFVFYDDVNFIKGGWVNRNKLLFNHEENYFTVPLHKQSSFIDINDTLINKNLYEIWKKKFFKSVSQNYKKAPFYKPVITLLEIVFYSEHDTIAQLAIESVKQTCMYLEIETTFETSSQIYPETKQLERADRLIEITKKKDFQEYINSIGGKELYSKDYFKQEEITLHFIENELKPYSQFQEPFIGGLSIIDVIMFNSIEDIHKQLDNYKLI